MSKLEHFKKNRKKIAPMILLTLIISGLVYYYLIMETSYTGQAEAVISTNPAEVSGKIVESNIALGQEVKAGDIIAVIDSRDLKYALEQLKLNLEKAVIQNADAQTGQDARAQSSIAAARAALNGAAAAAEKARQDYEKALALFADSAITESALEAAKLARDTTASNLSAARAQLELAQNNSTGSLTASTSVDILLLESRIAQQEDLIKKCTVTASADGIVISKNYRAGDFVAPGYNIADIAANREKLLVVYYPKEQISDIQYDKEISFVYNGTEYFGPVKFIDVKPQYTPQDFQTQANKNRESVKIKILIPDNCTIKPGETVKVNL